MELPKKTGRGHKWVWCRCVACGSGARLKLSRRRKGERYCRQCGGDFVLCEPAEWAELDRTRRPRVRRPKYADYLRSPLWFEIQKRVLKRDGYRCRCGGRATQVHHRSYAPAVMAGKDDSKLVSLCQPCHNGIHYRPDGTKRPRAETETLLAAIDRLAAG